MIYLPFIIIIIIGICSYAYTRDRISALKRDGIRVTDNIIHNSESPLTGSDRLGVNINTATIKLRLKDGEEIIAKPIIGFTSQREIVVAGEVFVIHDLKKPQTFYNRKSIVHSY